MSKAGKAKGKKKPGLKKKCCEKWRKKGKYCKRCPLVGER